MPATIRQEAHGIRTTPSLPADGAAGTGLQVFLAESETNDKGPHLKVNGFPSASLTLSRPAGQCEHLDSKGAIHKACHGAAHARRCAPFPPPGEDGGPSLASAGSRDVQSARPRPGRTRLKKKHASHALTADVGIGDTAAAAEFMRADAVIVTGSATGEQPTGADIAEVRARCRLPLYLGSGITPENLPRYYAGADGFIVGSAFKAGGLWSEPVDPRAVERFMSAHARCGASW